MGKNLLMVAAQFGQLQIVKYLVSTRAFTLEEKDEVIRTNNYNPLNHIGSYQQ